MLFESEVIIEADGLGKMYPIFDRPVDRLKQMIFGKLFNRQYGREFWAVTSASFIIRRGESIGLVGRNGSGKSTLLQMICGTLTPTKGTIEARGRVAALLELGSGFNPEFTGRENVYLNGSILGMSKLEMESRFNDIVSFAEIGDFLDQPVKTYSSGMAVRLAFAVVAHLDPDILVVDEALAVGDQFFQAKCMSRIRALRERGTTLLFVSHDSALVRSLCDRALLMHQGELVMDGEPQVVMERYFSLRVAQEQGESLVAPVSKQMEFKSLDWMTGVENFERMAAFERQRNGQADLMNVQLLDSHGQTVHDVQFASSLTIRFALKAQVALDRVCHGYHVRDANGYDILYSDSLIEGVDLIDLKPDSVTIVEWTFPVSLSAGQYSISVVCSVPQGQEVGKVVFCDFVPIAAQFTMMPRIPTPIYGRVHVPNTVRISKANNQ